MVVKAVNTKLRTELIYTASS